jgi:oligosaccharide repeat unit polymerase
MEVVVNLLGFTIAVVLLWRITKVTGNALTYAHLFSIVWGGTLLLSQLALEGAVSPQISTLLVLFAAWWAFLLGGLVLSTRPDRNLAVKVEIGRIRAVLIVVLLLALQWIAIIYEIDQFRIGAVSNLDELLSIYPALRASNTLSSVVLPWYLNLWRWGYVLYMPLALFLRSRQLISNRFLAVISVFAFSSTLIHFTRAPIVQLFVICLVCWLVLFKARYTTAILMLGISAAVVLIFFSVTQSALLTLDRSGQTSLAESFISYFGLSPKAYEFILQGHYPEIANGLYSLEPVNFLLYKLQVLDNYPGLIRPFLYLPYPTNLYTYLDAFTLDFGLWGALLGSFFLGALTAWFYRRVTSKPSPFNLIIYSYLVYCCILAPANNEFIRFAVPAYGLLAGLVQILSGVRVGSASAVDQSDLTSLVGINTKLDTG